MTFGRTSIEVLISKVQLLKSRSCNHFDFFLFPEVWSFMLLLFLALK
jgi:hypothetical protein